MNHYRGIIVSARQHGGCVEVIVDGDKPGTFVIDNCCVWAIVDCEGTNWVGRRVEYEDGLLRFLGKARQPATHHPKSRAM